VLAGAMDVAPPQNERQQLRSPATLVLAGAAALGPTSLLTVLRSKKGPRGKGKPARARAGGGGGLVRLPASCAMRRAPLTDPGWRRVAAARRTWPAGRAHAPTHP
jgi:hypothetical protein